MAKKILLTLALIFSMMWSATIGAQQTAALQTTTAQTNTAQTNTAQTNTPQTGAAREQKAAAPRPGQKRPDDEPRAGKARSIRGRVTDDAGQPVEDASVYILPAGSFNNQNSLAVLKIRPTSTDENGRFDIDNIDGGAYSFMAYAPGYVTVTGQSIDGGVERYYRPGEFISVRLVKGGVITGTVTSDAGAPIVGMRVKAVRVRDSQGRQTRGQNLDAMKMMEEWKTDDRGVYRIYGLEPGAYLVSAGGNALLSFQQEDGYAGGLTTYYPSSTRDAATEVRVAAGQESSNIDIRYRDGQGYAISGTISGANSASQEAIFVTVSQASTGAIESMTLVPAFLPNRSFSFYGMADGEYYVTAVSSGEKGRAAASPPRRVTVKGGDVTGLELALAPLGSVAGRVVVEALDSSRAPECKPDRKAARGEIVLLARRDEKSYRPRSFSPFEFFPSSTDSVPDEKGEFIIARLEPSRYHIETQLPNDALYVRAITSPNQTATAVRNGIQLKPGEQFTGLTITVSEGAANLGGKITSSNKDEQLPARVRAHLVPAEPESAKDAVRYREAMADADGAFAFSNVAPGRYLIIAREVQDSETGEDGPRPVAWDEQAREALRREAEKSGVTVELQPCRRVTDYALRFSPATKQPEK
jgi:protocatechuate 3,4-dioxygenase beta subunit